MDDSSFVRTRRTQTATAWDIAKGTVLIASGLPLPIAGTDGYHDFHAHPEFTYLAGVGVAAAVLAFDPGEGWSLFAPVASLEERVWVGDGRALVELAAASGIEQVQPSHALGDWLEARRGEPLALAGNHDFLQRPGAYGLQHWQALEAAVDEAASERLSVIVAEQRRAKSADEIGHIRAAVEASVAGHMAAMRGAQPGTSERQLQVEIEAEFFRHGGDRTAYGSIVGSGPNAAILHSTPGGRVLGEGDLVLVDAAAEFAGYASDITRTFPVARQFSGIQRDLYQLVHEVQHAAIDAVRPGVEYRDLHLDACQRIATGLVDLGILRGKPQDLVERDAHALFFPHGLGHMIGLSTHDAGGCLAGRTPSDRFGLKWLRADLPLEENYVITVEPGIYFIPAILEDPARRETFRDAVNWSRVDSLMPFGGIRIEDDVLVTQTGSEVLSAAIPKSIAGIEALRQEARS